MERLDVIVYGATGFTGKLIAENLATRLEPGGTSWGLAGRSRSKLEKVRESLGGAWQDLPIVTADSSDPSSLRAMAEGARVVITSVGPYTLYGMPVVEACVDAGTDYVDLTGEPGFWTEVVERFDARARERGALIVPCCGFDSIPADVGSFYLASEAKATRSLRIRGYLQIKSGTSGGTRRSGLYALSTAERPESVGRFHYQEQLERWALPLPMIDPFVVSRTAKNCLVFPDEFRYEHYLTARSRVRAMAFHGALKAISRVTRIEKVRESLLDRIPAGTGPSAEARAKGRFRLTLIGEADGDPLTCEVTGADPGYGHTAKMIGEAALTLVENRDELPHRGGVLTPASALGSPLIARLETTGMAFRRLE